MKPQVPEGLRVEYEYFTSDITPNGRRLARPHRGVAAYLLADHEGSDFPCIMGLGEALAKEGPTADETTGACDRPAGTCKLDQFSRQIGRDIALGRALKDYERLVKTAEAALSA